MSTFLGGEYLPEPDGEYYMALVGDHPDKSGLAVPLHEDSIGRIAIIDGDKERAWWVSQIYAINTDTDIVVVTTADDQPFYDFVSHNRLWDHDAATELIAELEFLQNNTGKSVRFAL